MEVIFCTETTGKICETLTWEHKKKPEWYS